MTISLTPNKTLGSFGSLGDATDAQESAKNDKRKPVYFLREISLFTILSRFLN